MHLLFENRTIATVHVGEVRGSRSLGRHVLQVPIDLSMFDYPKASELNAHLFRLSGEVLLAGRRGSIRPVLEQVGLQAQGRSVVLECELDALQVGEIDRARTSEAVPALLRLQGLVNVLGKGVGIAHGEEGFAVSAGSWLGFLRDSGFDERHIGEFLLSFPGQPERLAAAAKEMDGAKLALRIGDTDGVLTKCRRAIECALGQLSRPDFGRLNDVATRLDGVRYAVSFALHPGAHPNLGRATAAQANTLLLMTAVLLDEANRHAQLGG